MLKQTEIKIVFDTDYDLRLVENAVINNDYLLKDVTFILKQRGPKYTFTFIINTTNNIEIAKFIIVYLEEFKKLFISRKDYVNESFIQSINHYITQLQKMYPSNLIFESKSLLSGNQTINIYYSQTNHY